MKAIEDENRRLKRMYADLSMQADLLKEALGKMYGPPHYCKVFVSVAPACVNVSGL
jgi:putative transposase